MLKDKEVNGSTSLYFWEERQGDRAVDSVPLVK